MRIIIVGCGRVGRNIAEQLNTEEHSITIIDTNEDALSKIDDTQNILTIEGNGATHAVLDEAGVSNSDLVIAVTPTDELNLYCCLVAQNYGAKNTIARVRNPEYIKDMETLKDSLNISYAINPEKIGANEIARMIKYPGAVSVDSFSRGVVELIRIRLTELNSVTNKKVSECSIFSKNNIRICLVERNGETFIPNGDFELKAGDLMSFIAPTKETAKLLKSLGYISLKGNNVIILGGSKIAYYLANMLDSAGLKVKIIEKDEKRCEILSEKLNDVVVIYGDAMDEDLLMQEGIDKADTVVALMNTDEENVLASLFVKEINKDCKVVTELGNLKFTSIFDTLPLDSVVNPKKVTGENIVRYVRAMQNSIGSNVETMYKINGGEVEALEFIVKRDGKCTGIPLSKLNLKESLQIACIYRRRQLIIPTGETTIEPRDRVVVITKHKGLKDLDDILR